MPFRQNKKMNTLSKAIDLLRKHWMILVPTFLALLIPALLVRTNTNNVAEILREFSDNYQYYAQNSEALSELFAGIKTGVGTGGILSTILNFAAVPMTAGLLRRVLEDQPAGFGEFAMSLSENIITYLKHVLGLILFGISIGIISLIYFLILLVVVFSGNSINLGVLLFGTLFFMIALMVVGVFLTFWFAAMVLEDYTLFAAVKRSFTLVGKCFWKIVGVTLLIQISFAILTGIAGAFVAVPLVGPLLSSVVAATGSVLMMTFAFVLYKEQTQDEGSFDRNVESYSR